MVHRLLHVLELGEPGEGSSCPSALRCLCTLLILSPAERPKLSDLMGSASISQSFSWANPALEEGFPAMDLFPPPFVGDMLAFTSIHCFHSL